MLNFFYLKSEKESCTNLWLWYKINISVELLNYCLTDAQAKTDSTDIFFLIILESWK